MSPASSIAVAVVFVWLGMVMAISFIETPLKFRAPGVTLQIGLGIATLLAHVPLNLGLLHQGGGALVLVMAVVHLHATRRAGIVLRDFSSRGRASA